MPVEMTVCGICCFKHLAVDDPVTATNVKTALTGFTGILTFITNLQSLNGLVICCWKK